MQALPYREASGRLKTHENRKKNLHWTSRQSVLTVSIAPRCRQAHPTPGACGKATSLTAQKCHRDGKRWMKETENSVVEYYFNC